MRYPLSPPLVFALFATPVLAQVSDKEVRQQLEPWFESSPYSVKAQTERYETARSLSASMGPLDEKSAAKWRKSLLKLWEGGSELPKKSGDRWYFEDEKPERGRYIIGGKTSRPKGLLIAMHGGGLGSADAGPAASMYGGPASTHKWVMIAPQALEATELGWTTSGTEEWLLDLVDQGRRTFGVDPDHVYFAGHSMGGFGSWTLGAHHADRVAALAPSAGAPTPYLNRETDAVEGIVPGVIPSLRNTPMVVFQSTDDPRVPPGPNQYAVKEIGEAKQKWGGYDDFEYWEVDDVGHGPPKEGIGALIKKIADFERKPLPTNLAWQPDLFWKQQFHWLNWVKPVMGSIVVAERSEEDNSFTLTVTNDRGQPLTEVRGLSVLLDDRLVDMDKPVRVTLNGEVIFEDVPERNFFVLSVTSQTGDPELQFEASAPPLS